MASRIARAARRLGLLALLIWAAGPGSTDAIAQGAPVLVFAAASMKNALDDATAQYEREEGAKVTTSYAASSALAKQIEAGAPADIFISADLDWMDYLDQKKLIKPGTRMSLLGNKIVLVAPTASTAVVTIQPGFPLAQLLGDGR